MTFCASFSGPAPNTLVRPALSLGVDIILPTGSSGAEAHMAAALFRSANDLLQTAAYQVSVRTLGEQPAGDARYWTRRTAIFMGGISTRWTVTPEERNRTAQILHLAARPVLAGSAVFLLHETGMHRVHQAAIHPNFAAAAQEYFLTPATNGELVAQSGNIHSAISGFAAIKLLLDMIREDQGQVFVDALSSYLGLCPASTQPVSKALLELRRRAAGDVLIDKSLGLMCSNLEEPLQICDLASELGVSTRKLQRRFQDKTGSGPLNAYRQLRLERARQLLEHSSLPLPEVAAATGFGTQLNLAYWFKREHGETPKTIRRMTFQGGMVSATA